MIEPEIDSHIGNASQRAALGGVTDTGLLSFLLFYPLVQWKFSEISEIFFFFFLTCLFSAANSLITLSHPIICSMQSDIHYTEI